MSMRNVRLGNRVNRISSSKIGYIPTLDYKQRAIQASYHKRMAGHYAIRDIEIYCRYKHKKIDAKEIAKRFAIKPDGVKRIYYKVAKQIKEWKDNE
jgi:hypothetical protein